MSSRTLIILALATQLGSLACEGRVNTDADAPVAHVDDEQPSLGPGTTTDPTDPGEVVEPTDIDECAQIAPVPVADVPVRMLTTEELNNALAELFASLAVPRFEMPNDSRVGSFVLNAREQVAVAHVVDFRLMAEEMGVLVADSVDQVAPCDESDTAGLAGCAEAAIVGLAELAFRRPLQDVEREGLVGLWTVGQADGGHAQGMRIVVEAVLQSPSFVYVAEEATAPALDDYEIAQRMAATLWRSIPDAALAAAAANGELSDATQREAHARRMLQSPFARSTIRMLVLQWLGFDRLAQEAFAATELVEAMGAETVRLIDHVIDERQSSWVDLLTSRYTFVDATLAAHYGIDVADGTEVATGVYRVELSERAGLLTHAGFLALHHGPVHRGLAVRKAVLCGDVPGPTNVDTESIPTGPTESERSKSEKRLASNSCGGCHAMMDPLGLALDPFNTLGQFEAEDRYGNPLFGDGEVVAGGERMPVASAVDLADTLVAVDDSRRCVAKNLFTWTFARPPGGADNCTVARVEDSLRSGGDNLQEALVQIIAHEMFVQRTPAAGE